RSGTMGDLRKVLEGTHRRPQGSLEQPVQLRASFLSKSKGQHAAHFDDGPADAAAVRRQPGDELLAGEPLGLAAPLGRDQVLRSARATRQRAQFRGAQRLLDEVALLDLVDLLLREKLP